jgi:hypothetical protein
MNIMSMKENAMVIAQKKEEPTLSGVGGGL